MSDDLAAAGFRALGLRLGSDDSVPVYVFIKAHAGSEHISINKRALFVAGLPLAVREPELQQIFEAFGVVQSAVAHPGKNGAIVLYEAEGAREKALQAAAAGQQLRLELPEPEGPIGLKGWVEEHKRQFPGNDVIKKQLDEWMGAFERAQEAEKAAAAAAVDEGWTLVTRGKGRKKSGTGTGTVVGAVAPAVAEAKAAGKKVQQLTNFYRFQQREKRRNELLELREKFEDDKRRIADMKALRRFKPY